VDGPIAEILVEDGKEKGRLLPLRPDKVVDIGREGTFRLDDRSLSRHHARIVFEGSGYRVEDCGSSWGTFVNGNKITAHDLRDGDRIRVGTHTLLFTLDEVPSAPAVPAAPASIPTPMAPIAAAAVRALPVEDEEDDIPAAPAAAPAASAAAEEIPSAPAARSPAPPTAPPPAPASSEPTTGSPPLADEDEIAKPGTCFSCGKPAADPPADAPPDPLGNRPRAYCGSCSTQYPLLGRVIANHLCEKVLGAGGMGVVYRGVHVVMARKAALKTLKVLGDADPTLVKRLLREATAGGRIHHPNIVAVHDTGEQDGIAYVVMEYVRGEDLSDALRREKKFAVKRAVRMASQVADALAAAFKLGFIHRDIKPENILLMPNDGVKVTDFGLAKNLKDGELGGLTRTGQVLGTMLYMPPEQIVSSKGSDQRADIYSLGATLFHLLSGRPVFDSKSAISLLMDIRTKAAPDISSIEPGVPASVAKVLQRCLQKKPDDRYQTPEELAAELRKALATL
jgi:serine/threonine-protein kinase